MDGTAIPAMNTRPDRTVPNFRRSRMNDQVLLMASSNLGFWFSETSSSSTTKTRPSTLLAELPVDLRLQSPSFQWDRDFPATDRLTVGVYVVARRQLPADFGQQEE